MNTIQFIPIVVAGGRGTRMGGEIRKQYLMLDNLPVLVRTLDVFDRHPDMACIIVVVPEKDMGLCRTQILNPRRFLRTVHLIPGGSRRQQSVRNGVQKALALADDPRRTLVLIHDGVRPFVSGKLLDRLTHTAIQAGDCIPVLPVTDTLKQVDDQSRIIATVDRKGLFQAQTPQVFRLDRISRALDHAETTGFFGTDDASVMAHAGFEVTSVPGDPANIKLTTSHDLALARHLILTQTV
ncbi:MAG: 2-C-methyl-D-erythritol 4-phosphate cytidylyltransferase [Desulfotignum sp.]|nr:2-C-methyl-D-erythritol 4-phosphate cytidylyltransferase [Desulfotignum sp.]